MANVLTVEKVTALPTTFTPSTLYLLKTTNGFLPYLSTVDGSALEALDIPTSPAVVQYINSITAGTLIVQTGTIRWYAPRNLTITRAELFVSTPPSGADIKANIDKNGVTQTTATLAAGSYYVSDDLVTPISMVAGDYLTYDITQVGSTNAGSDLQIRLSYT